MSLLFKDHCFPERFELDGLIIYANEGQSMTYETAYQGFLTNCILDIQHYQEGGRHDIISRYRVARLASIHSTLDYIIRTDPLLNDTMKKEFEYFMKQRMDAIIEDGQVWTNTIQGPRNVKLRKHGRVRLDDAIEFIHKQKYTTIDQLRNAKGKDINLIYSTDIAYTLTLSVADINVTWSDLFQSLYPWMRRWGNHPYGSDLTEEKREHLKNDLCALLYIEEKLGPIFFLSMLREPSSQTHIYSGLKDAYYNYKIKHDAYPPVSTKTNKQTLLTAIATRHMIIENIISPTKST